MQPLRRIMATIGRQSDQLRLRADCSARLRDLERWQYADPERLRGLQADKLTGLLRHAFEHVPFYRDRFREAGIAPGDIRDPEDLRKLPPLTKSDLQGHLSELVATSLAPGALHRSATGGSTGEHTPFYRDNACLGRKMAIEHRFNRWTGWCPGDRIALVWPALQDFTPAGRGLNPLRWLPSRRLMLYAGKLDEATLAAHVARLNAFRPHLIRAFPNPLSVLARYARQVGGLTARPRGIITVGEPLLEGHRALFEEVFGCPVFNVYVSRECGHMAGECASHHGLHIAAESLIIELEDEEGPAAPGRPGQVLVTDLENYGMPFIRYRIGDMGASSSERCPCGRGLPLMEMTAGRVSDFIVAPHDGSLVSGASLCHYLIAEGPEVGQLQIVQDAADHLTIRIKRCGAYREGDLGHFDRTIARLFDGRMRTTFEFVDSIARDRSGKYRFCINQVAGSPPVGASPDARTP